MKFTVSSPSPYQISHYNIYPPPVVHSSSEITKQVTIHAHLVDEATNKLITCGFKSGDVLVMKPGRTQVKFRGLKLNKIGPIKSELGLTQVRSLLERPFRIQYHIEGIHVIKTQPFVIASTCNQLPSSLREEVRPMKRTEGSTKRKKQIKT